MTNKEIQVSVLGYDQLYTNTTITILEKDTVNQKNYDEQAIFDSYLLCPSSNVPVFLLQEF